MTDEPNPDTDVDAALDRLDDIATGIAQRFFRLIEEAIAGDCETCNASEADMVAEIAVTQIITAIIADETDPDRLIRGAQIASVASSLLVDELVEASKPLTEPVETLQ